MPWPWPKLILQSLISLTLLKWLTAMNGSDPGDRMNKKGVWGEESGYILLRSKGNDLVNSHPRYSSTKRLKPSIIFYGLRHLQIISLFINPMLLYFSGNFFENGREVVVIYSNNPFSLPVKSCIISSKEVNSASLQKLFHISSVIHFYFGFSMFILLGEEVVDNKNLICSFFGCFSLKVMSAESKSLSFWNKLRLIFLNRLNRKQVLKFNSRNSTFSFLSLLSIAILKISIKQFKEY